MTQVCIQRDQRLDELNNCWEDQFRLLIDQAVSEIQTAESSVTEKTIRQNANL